MICNVSHEIGYLSLKYLLSKKNFINCTTNLKLIILAGLFGIRSQNYAGTDPLMVVYMPFINEVNGLIYDY